MTRKLEEAFGVGEEGQPHNRGRPPIRTEDTSVISFRGPVSVHTAGRERTNEHKGLFTRYMTIVYLLFIAWPIEEVEAYVAKFEKEYGPIEKVTAEVLDALRDAGRDGPHKPT